MFNKMELMHHYTIFLDPCARQEDFTITGRGARCPTCGKSRDEYVKPRTGSDSYSFQAAHFLMPRPANPIREPVCVVYRFFLQANRRVRKTGLEAKADRLLKECGILHSDDFQQLVHHDGTRVLVDPQNPRTEIWIYSLKEEQRGNQTDSGKN